MNKYKALCSLAMAALWIGCNGPEVVAPPHGNAVSALTAAAVDPNNPPDVAQYEAEAAAYQGPVFANNQTGFTGTGFIDYVNNSNDYVEYTVYAASAQTASLAFTYANGGATSRPLSLKVNGVTISASLAFPATGGWSNWAKVTAQSGLNAGANKIRLTAIGSSGGNFDNLVVTRQTAQPAVYQAESATRSGPTVSSIEPGYTGTGYLDYQNASNDYTQWTLSVPSNQAYTLAFRYANGGTASRPLRIDVDGVVFEASLPFPPTGSWRTWQLVTRTLTLGAGSHLIRATAIGSNGSNIDYLSLVPATGGAPTPSAASPTRNPTPTWTWSGAGPFEWRISGSGNPTGAGTAISATSYTPSANLAQGTWYFQVRERDGAGNWSAWSASSVVVIDATPPAITNISIPNNFVTNQASIRIDYKADGVSNLKNCALTLNSAANTCAITASDALGNTSTVNVSVWRRSNVLFVRYGASGGGTSFDDALGSLREALGRSGSGQNEIWVMEGTHNMTGTPGPTVPSGTKIYGGFSMVKNQGSVSDRNVVANPTILNSVATESDGGSPREILRVANEDGSTVRDVTLDGLTIRAGYYGILIFEGENIVLNNCIASNSVAAGVMNIENSNATLNNCSFNNNVASSLLAIGGNKTVTFNQCRFRDNHGGSGNISIYGGTVAMNSTTFQNTNALGNSDRWIIVDVTTTMPSLRMNNCIIQGYGQLPARIVDNHGNTYPIIGSGNHAP